MGFNMKVTPEIEALTKVCEENSKMDVALYGKYDVKRGLRDINGKGVLAGLTQVSNIVSSKTIDGKSVPCDGELYYRGINIKDLTNGFLKENRFGFEETTYLLLFGVLPTEEQLKESQEIKTETGVVLSWKYLCWVREHPVKSICKETNILYGTQDEMIPYKIVKKFSEENNCRLNFVENGQHWLHTDREVAAMRKWEQTVLEESRSIIPNK